MNYLGNESFLLDLLEKNNLLSVEQRKLIVLKKEQPRRSPKIINQFLRHEPIQLTFHVIILIVRCRI
jgi:hypothetical protein